MKTERKTDFLPVGIYVHIPFCGKKCDYCDFLSFPAKAEMQRQYIDALRQEIRDTAKRLRQEIPPDRERKKETGSIFIGGGTPSLLPAEWIAEILWELRRQFVFSEGAEITLEANPGTVDAEKLRIYRRAGINRISFGCQSFHEEELRILGRIHTVREIRESVQLARGAGFVNINLDLMSGLPGQTLSSWEDTLRQAIALQPEHISAYSLILEEGTPFYSQYGENAPCHVQFGETAGQADSSCKRADGRPEGECGVSPKNSTDGRAEKGVKRSNFSLPEEETERRMYERTGEILAEAGYRQYEISNYAKEGYACRHNFGYWTGVPYYGFGLGASGYLPETWFGGKKAGEAGVPLKCPAENICQRWIRYRNTCDIQGYINGTGEYDELQRLDARDLQAEFMILGLRLTEGVEDAEFAGRFGKTIDSVYGAIFSKYTKTGHLIRKSGRTYLSQRGISVSNTILADFL